MANLLAKSYSLKSKLSSVSTSFSCCYNSQNSCLCLCCCCC